MNHFGGNYLTNQQFSFYATYHRLKYNIHGTLEDKRKLAQIGEGEASSGYL